MKKLLKVSLFTLGIVLSSNAMAATGIGHAQAQLSNPLTVANQTDVNFGTIAIDPGAGAQALFINGADTVTCPATYVCTGTPTSGKILVTGAPSTMISSSVSGQTATLDDGSGNTLTFDPQFDSEGVREVSSDQLNLSGVWTGTIGGTINFSGSETAGTYTTQNGTGYTVTVNYP